MESIWWVARNRSHFQQRLAYHGGLFMPAAMREKLLAISVAGEGHSHHAQPLASPLVAWWRPWAALETPWAPLALPPVPDDEQGCVALKSVLIRSVRKASRARESDPA